MNLLVYFPYNRRAGDVLSFVGEAVDRGHRVFVLTTCERGRFHEMADALGATTAAHVVPKAGAIAFHLRHARHLLAFCRAHGIELVVSHADANLAALLARPFGRFAVLSCRHHVDWAYLNRHRKAMLLDRIVNRLAQHLVVPSRRVRDQVVSVEGADASKVHLIPYGYRFSLYPAVNEAHAAAIRAQYPARLRLVTVSRLTPGKRLPLAFEAIARLAARGCDVRLLVLGEGPDRAALEAWIAARGLSGRVSLIGFREDLFDFVAASDLSLHLSVEEASNNAVKEIGWLGRPSVVCRGVGDFDDYLVDGEHGFLVDRDDPLPALDALLARLCQDGSALPAMGARARAMILERFDIARVFDRYAPFIR
ncbi:MAG: glycosyltransferase family 4 protein [Acidobacteria bacterium]|nr:glycosyltransferase family 4 protein [Acidobacteriota bacterium]